MIIGGAKGLQVDKKKSGGGGGSTYLKSHETQMVPTENRDF